MSLSGIGHISWQLIALESGWAKSGPEADSECWSDRIDWQHKKCTHQCAHSGAKFNEFQFISIGINLLINIYINIPSRSMNCCIEYILINDYYYNISPESH